MKTISWFKRKKSEGKSELYNFLVANRPNSNGITLEEMRNYSFEDIDRNRNYFQWMFPTVCPFGENQPFCLTREVYQSEEAQQSIRKSFYVILNYYGFIWKDGRIVRSDNYEQRTSAWLRVGNHNYWRIARIIECLNQFELTDEANQFLAVLTQIYNETDLIEERAYTHWVTVNIPSRRAV